MAQSIVGIQKSYADAAALQAWLGQLATDVGTGKVEGLQVVTTPGGGTGGTISGQLTLSSATAVSGLTVPVED
jgi:hypothetical protein